MTHVFNAIEVSSFIRGVGVTQHIPVVVCSTQNVDLTADLSLAAVDGIVVGVGNRVLLINQTLPVDNGIYVIGDGANTTRRVLDFVDGDITEFCEVDVSGGTYSNTKWVCTSSGTVGDTDTTWAMRDFLNYTENGITYADSSFTRTELQAVPGRIFTTALSGQPQWGNSLPAGTIASEPTSGNHVATRDYVDINRSGSDSKESVRVRTTADIAGTYTAGTFTGVDFTANFDLEVTIAVGDRVLIMNQTDAKQNGIYVVTGANTCERSPDQNTNDKISGGNFTFVETGPLYAASGYVIAHDGDIVLNTDDIVWTQYTNIELTAGTALDITNDTVSVNIVPNGGLTLSSNSLQVNLAASAIVGTLQSGDGGTGFTSYANGDLLVGGASLTKLPAQSMGVLTVDYYATTPAVTSVKWSNEVNLASIRGVSAAEPQLLAFTNTNTAVNYLGLSNAVANANPRFSALGGSANVGIDIATKGNGTTNIFGGSVPGEIRLYNGARYTGLRSQASSDVTFRLPADDGVTDNVLVTNGSGNLSFKTINSILPVNALAARYSLMALEVRVSNNSFSSIAYFSWNQTEYASYATGKLLYEVDLGNRDIEIDLFNDTTSTSLGSVIHTNSGFYTLAVSIPTANARLVLQTRKTQNGGRAPRIYGVQLEFQI
tara:strand:- start:38187 stop:40163 length:1977 start_codon:yes stop_codon:yes gene_type:complete